MFSSAASAGVVMQMPTRSPASEYDFDSVRSTTTFGWRAPIDVAFSSAKSAYASSTIRRASRRACASSSSALRGTEVPDGAFGLQTISMRAATENRSLGIAKSGPYGTRIARPTCRATSVSYNEYVGVP